MFKNVTFINGLIFTALLFCGELSAQTLGAITGAPTCTTPNGATSVTVPYSGFAAGVTISVFLSDAAGVFPGTSVGSGVTTATGTSVSISTLIPSTAVSGVGYKLRAVSGAVTGAATANFSVAGQPTGFVATYTFCVGDAVPASFNAADLRWYTAATGGTVVSPSTFTNAAGNATYFVAKLAGAGSTCENPTRQSIGVNVSAATVTGVTFSLSGAQPFCAGVARSGNVAFAATCPPPSYNITLYTSTNTFVATLLVGSTSTTTNTVTIPAATGAGTYKIGVKRSNSPGALPDAFSADFTINATPNSPVVSGTTVCQGGTATISATGTGLGWTSPGSAVASPTPPNISTTTASTTAGYAVTQTVGGCTSAPTNFSVVVSATPPTPDTQNIGPACSGNVILSATIGNTAPGATVTWYSGPNGTGTASTTPQQLNYANAGTFNYSVQQSIGACSSPIKNYSFTINAQPPQLSVAAVGPLCAGSGNYTSAVTNATGALTWFSGPNGTGTSSANATVTSLANANSFTYSVIQTINGCNSQFTNFSVVVNAVPNAPGISSPITYCLNDNAAPLAATGSNLRWYGTNASGGAASASSPTPSTGSSATYFVSQVVNGCESSRVGINVVVRSISSAPGVPASTIMYCQNETPAALTASGASLAWYGSASGGAAFGGTPTFGTNNAGVLNYFVSQTQPNTCESPRTQVQVVINATPTPPSTSTVTYCQFVGATPLTAVVSPNGFLNWYGFNQSGGSSTTNAPTPATGSAGQSTYFVSQTINYSVNSVGKSCEGPRAALTVVINAQPTAPTAPTNLTYCQNTPSVPLTATGSNLRWFDGGNNFMSNNAPTPPTNSAGTQNYSVSQSISGCEGPKSTIQVTIFATPALPSVSNPTYCQFDTPSPVLATGQELRWYTVPSGGNPTNTAPTPSTATSGLSFFYATQTINGCEGPRARLDVFVKDQPARPGVLTPQSYCQEGSSFNLNATGQNQVWYANATGGTGNITAPVINKNNPGTTSYFVTQTVNACESLRSEIQVTVKPQPAAPATPSTTLSLCQNDPVRVLEATGTDLRWFNNSNQFINNTAPTIQTAIGGVTNFFVTQTINGCESTQTKIEITIKTTPAPTSEPTVVYCQGTTATPLVAQGTAIKWYRPDGGTSAVFTPFTSTPGTYSVFATQTGSNGCESPRTEVKVIIQPFANADISGDANVAQGQSATLKIDFRGQAPWTYTLSNGFSTSTTQNPTLVTVTPLETTTYTITSVTNACGNGLPSGSATVTVRTSTINTGNPSVSLLCAGQSFNVGYTSSDFFPAGTVFRVQIATDQNSTNFITLPTTGSGGSLTATVPPNTPGGTYFVRASGVAPNFTVAGRVSQVQLLVRALPTATLTGPANIFAGDNAKLTILLTAESPWTVTYADSSEAGVKNTNVDVATSPFEFETKPAATTTYRIVSVSNGCGLGAANSRLQVRVNAVTANEPTVNDDWLTVYPSPATDFCTVEIKSMAGFKPASITLTDALGRPFMAHKTQQTRHYLDLIKLPVGIYFLRVESEGRTAVRKIMKTDR